MSTPQIAALALTAFLAAACVNTREAQASLEADLAALQQSVAALNEAEAAGASQDELEALRDAVEASASSVKESTSAVADAASDDWAAIKTDAPTWFGLTQGGAQGGLLGVGLTALSWFMRDRRKRLGADPLQLAGVETPPTSGENPGPSS